MHKGRYKTPQFCLFELHNDFKYLQWYRKTESMEVTRIRIKEIRDIAVGSESRLPVIYSKKNDAAIVKASCTIYWGKANNPLMWKHVTVTALNQTVLREWTDILNILSVVFQTGLQCKIDKTDAERVSEGNKRIIESLKSNSCLISTLNHRFNIYWNKSISQRRSYLNNEIQKCVEQIFNVRGYYDLKQIKMILNEVIDMDRDIGKKPVCSVNTENKLVLACAYLDALQRKMLRCKR